MESKQQLKIEIEQLEELYMRLFEDVPVFSIEKAYTLEEHKEALIDAIVTRNRIVPVI